MISFIPVASQAQKQKAPAESAQAKRARLLVAKGDLVAAIAVCDEAIKINPASAEMYLKRGIAFRLQGALDKAIEDFDKATTLDPASTRNDRVVAQAYGNHGQVHLTNLRPEDAIVDFEKALKIDPVDSRPYFDRAEARILLEDFAGAITDLNTYLGRERWGRFSEALALADRSLAQRLLGRDKEAKKDLEAIAVLAEEVKQVALLHMRDLEARVMILRRLRSQQQRITAKNESCQRKLAT
jgi:tetratricopeptide (TPR) repeat protein